MSRILYPETRRFVHQVVVSRKRPFSSLSKQAATASLDTATSDRWWAVPPANMVHLSIGSVYVYSMSTPGMTTALGVVGSAPLDWMHAQVLPVFSTAAVTLGVTTSLLGSWVEKVGPRKAGVVGSIFWSSALCTTALGVDMHSLPLVYLGYGLLGGVGWGLMYLAPVTTVMKWFPDRRGLATGLALSAFGAGAAIAPAIIQATMDFFSVPPDYIGPTLADLHHFGGNDSKSIPFVQLSTLENGSQVVANSSALGEPGQPVIVATEADVGRLSNVSTGPGAYALGTGDTGTAKAFGTLGVFYGAMGALGARFMTVPHKNWKPTANGAVSSTEMENQMEKQQTHHNIGLPTSYVTTSTSQFPLLWLSVFGNATGGLALLSSSKLMLTDIWQGVAPSIVTTSFATGYVSALGVGMAVGRFGWSALSDYLGRQRTYALFGLIGMPMMALAPTLCHTTSSLSVSDNTTMMTPLLYTFYGGSILAITCYGGVFSVLPAYIADLFGQKHAGAIHGKALTAWAASAVAGPMGLAYMRSKSVQEAIDSLLGSITDESVFYQSFGCHLDDASHIQTLVDAKTITIGRLMELVPDGTVDPTPFLYDSTCYAAAGLMSLSFLANLAIRPLADVKAIAARLENQETPK